MMIWVYNSISVLVIWQLITFNFLCLSRHIKHDVFHQSLFQLFSNYSAKIIYVCNKNKLTVASIDYSCLIFPNKIFTSVYKGDMNLCLKFYKGVLERASCSPVSKTKLLLLTIVQKYQIHKLASNNW